MKKIISFLLVSILVMGLGIPALAAPPPTKETVFAGFIDTDNPAIVEAANRGFVNGDGNGKFRPVDAVTRAEWVQMLYNTFCADKKAVTNSEPWWWPAATWLEESLFAVVGQHDHMDCALCEEVCNLAYVTHNNANESAPYRWMVATFVLVVHRCDEVIMPSDSAANFVEMVVEHAASIGYGADDVWRYRFRGDGASRFEAVMLLIGLYDSNFYRVRRGETLPPEPPITELPTTVMGDRNGAVIWTEEPTIPLPPPTTAGGN